MVTPMALKLQKEKELPGFDQDDEQPGDTRLGGRTALIQALNVGKILQGKIETFW